MSSQGTALRAPVRRPRLVLAGAGMLAAAGAALAAIALGGPARAPVRPPAHRVGIVAEAPDPLAAQSFPDPAGALRHRRAAAPRVAAAAGPAAPSLAEVERQLAEL